MTAINYQGDRFWPPCSFVAFMFRAGWVLRHETAKEWLATLYQTNSLSILFFRWDTESLEQITHTRQ